MPIKNNKQLISDQNNQKMKSTVQQSKMHHQQTK